MAEKTRIETKRLRESAKAGKSADEIMETRDIRDMASLKQALEGLMQANRRDRTWISD